MKTPEENGAELKDIEPVQTKSVAKRLSFITDEDEDLI